MIQTFRYVLHSEVPAFAAQGWIAHDSLDGTHHGQYSTLMEYVGENTRESCVGTHINSLAPCAPDAKHIRRDFNSASKREGFHTSTNPFASVSAMVTRRRKTSHSFPQRPFLVQFAIDVLAVLFAFLFVAVTGIGLGFAVFSILFLSF